MPNLNLHVTVITDRFYEIDINIAIGWSYFSIGSNHQRQWIDFYLPVHDFAFLEHLLWLTRNEKLVRAIAPFEIEIDEAGKIQDAIPF
ncbi:MAG: hypothetical protein ACLFT0_12580 [Spirulinaceae cyanobacterium]